jgi:hypothetical protein
MVCDLWVRGLATSWSRSNQKQAPDKIRVLNHKGLSDVAAEREAKQIEFLQIKRADEIRGVLRNDKSGTNCSLARSFGDFCFLNVPLSLAAV